MRSQTGSRMSNRLGFIPTMDCLPVEKLPEGTGWTYEIKLDGYRIEAVRDAKGVTLYSRKGNVFTQKLAHIAEALESTPKDTVCDGEVVALGKDGRPDFNLLQNIRSAQAHIVYYVFDILVHEGRDLTRLPLSERRQILSSALEFNDLIRLSVVSPGPLAKMVSFVKAHGLEGIVAKRADSHYQPGLRTGSWVKKRVNTAQEFVIGGYVPGGPGVDSIIIGIYKDGALQYVARVRAGFVPATRRKVFEQIQRLKIAKCPFSNVPEKTAGRWGQGLTAEKMNECVWVKPEMVAEVEFLEWTDGDKLRHAKFVRLRDDKDPQDIIRET